MTQKQYDEMDWKKKQIKEDLKDTIITPEEAYDALRLNGFGHHKAVQLVDEWGRGIYVPYSIWSRNQNA
jgi:hypothetical protein